jgi:E3 ubiquitin-protein ligase MARCH6
VNGSREIVRPGAFWFVQDPHEREVNPIRDILERSAWLQLKKLGSSAEIYGFTVLLAALTMKLIMLVMPGLTPFTWTPRLVSFTLPNSLYRVVNLRYRSSVASPYDMFLLVMAMPYIERYIRLEKFLLSWTAWIWQRFAKRLKLTSYLYGTEPETEEEGGQWKRVPATDAIPINPKIQLVVTVKKDGTPQDDAAKRMLEAQDLLAVNAGRDPKKDYRLVYYPPHFRWRLLSFFACSWLVLISSIAVLMAISVSLGRGLLSLIWNAPIHDGHSFLVGFAALWLALTFGRALERMDLRRQRQPGWDGPGASWTLWTVKCGLHWLGSVTYMSLVLGIVIPVLVALVVDVYIIYPMRLALSPGTQVRFKVIETWMLGVMYCVLHIGRWRRSRTRVGRGLDRVRLHLIST